MLQLLSPAGNTEAVIAAVQSGADIVYMGYGVSGARGEEMGFSPEQLRQALRYCRTRGCKSVFALGDLCSDTGLTKALDRAKFAAENGADALMVQDLGLIRVLRDALPELPLWGDVRMGVNSLDGALAAAALGLEYVVLSPELSLEQIRHIAENAPIKTIVFVHGQLCFAHAGQCHISALKDPAASNSCSQCGDTCRQRFSLGGRLDDYPMSMKDICLLDHIRALEAAGVACAAIEGHSRSAEFIAFSTELYALAIREKVLPTAEERAWLSEYFATNGLTDGYLTGDPETDMFGVLSKPNRDARRLFRQVRDGAEGYMKKERRRIPLKFFVWMEPGKPARFAVQDNRGRQAHYEGYVPIDLGGSGITQERLKDLLYRTGGTPYTCADVECRITPGLDYPTDAVEEARKALLKALADQSQEPKAPKLGPWPPKPEPKRPEGPAKFLFQIHRPEQLTEALAACEPDGLYVPAELIANHEPGLQFFRDRGCPIMAVMPRIAGDDELPEIEALLQAVKDQGITDILAGSFRYLRLARLYGLNIRGDSGLNATNAASLEQLRMAGFRSATVSFELSFQQIQAMVKPLDTEMIVYGRLPAMVSEQCIIRRSQGRCACSGVITLQDEEGRQYPVFKEFGCRNVIFDSSKVYMADKLARCQSAGLWGLRLLFSSESPRECVEVARQYKFTGLSRRDFRPNNIRRGLYEKGAIS